MGSEHAVLNPKSAQTWLTRELKEMGKGPLEPMIDPISADGDLARIHLRAFVASRYNPDLLLEAYIRTANEYHGEIRTLEQYWQAAVARAVFPTVNMEEFIRAMKKQSYPAMHHSVVYKKLYRPAYRIVALAFCPRTWL